MLGVIHRPASLGTISFTQIIPSYGPPQKRQEYIHLAIKLLSRGYVRSRPLICACVAVDWGSFVST